MQCKKIIDWRRFKIEGGVLSEPIWCKEPVHQTTIDPFGNKVTFCDAHLKRYLAACGVEDSANRAATR